MSCDIHLDDKYGQLNLVDIPAEIAGNEPWFNSDDEFSSCSRGRC